MLKIGLQLYSVRNEMKEDMEKTLKAVKEMGYDYVEFAGYFDKSAEEVRSLLDKTGLKAISVHQAYNDFLEGDKAYVYLKTLGVKYCGIPWMGIENHKGSDIYDETIENITFVGKRLKEYDIQLLYHNHEFEFAKFEDKYLLDWLYDSVPEDLLKTELDTCWVRYGGEDPVAYLKKYSGRAPVVHLKDFTCKELGAGPVYELIGNKSVSEQRADNEFKFKPLGKGMQEFKSILKASEEAGAEYAIVEQDNPDSSPLEDAKISREYLKTLGY